METITEMDLARLVFGADEMKCESPTHDYGRVRCSHDVTALRHHKCNGPLHICSAMANRSAFFIARPLYYCECGRSISECWNIRPI